MTGYILIKMELITEMMNECAISAKSEKYIKYISDAECYKRVIKLFATYIGGLVNTYNFSWIVVFRNGTCVPIFENAREYEGGGMDDGMWEQQRYIRGILGKAIRQGYNIVKDRLEYIGDIQGTAYETDKIIGKNKKLYYIIWNDCDKCDENGAFINVNISNNKHNATQMAMRQRQMDYECPEISYIISLDGQKVYGYNEVGIFCVLNL